MRKGEGEMAGRRQRGCGRGGKREEKDGEREREKDRGAIIETTDISHHQQTSGHGGWRRHTPLPKAQTPLPASLLCVCTTTCQLSMVQFGNCILLAQFYWLRQLEEEISLICCLQCNDTVATKPLQTQGDFLQE